MYVPYDLKSQAFNIYKYCTCYRNLRVVSYFTYQSDKCYNLRLSQPTFLEKNMHGKCILSETNSQNF